MHPFPLLDMPSPTGEQLKAARIAVGLSQIEAAALMGYPVQAGSRGGLQSRTWQALESETDPRTMPGPIFAMFQLLTGKHVEFMLVNRTSTALESASSTNVRIPNRRACRRMLWAGSLRKVISRKVEFMLINSKVAMRPR